MIKFEKKNLFIYLLISAILSVALILSNLSVYAKQDKDVILNNKIIYLDAGHGGKDNGASVDNILEDSINLSISNYLLEELMRLGAYVLMSRTGDYDLASLYQKNRKREDLNNRVKYINKSNPDIFISIHLNIYSSSSVTGAQVFFQNNENSKHLANVIQSKFNKLNKKDKKSKKGDYFILNNSKPVGVLIECGFLSNDAERNKLTDSNYQQKIANVISEGIVDYFML